MVKLEYEKKVQKIIRENAPRNGGGACHIPLFDATNTLQAILLGHVYNGKHYMLPNQGVITPPGHIYTWLSRR